MTGIKMTVEDDVKRKGAFSNIIHRLSQLETDVRKLKSSSELTDSLHLLAGLSSITHFPSASGIEDDIKRKGMYSEIIRRITKLETDVRKLQARG